MAGAALAAGAAGAAAGKAAENAPQISKAVTDYKQANLGMADARLDIAKRQVKFFGGLILVVVGGVVAWKLGKYIIKQGQLLTSRELGGGLSQATQIQSNDGSTQSNINATQAITLADQQYAAMAGWGSTGFNTMYNSLANVNGKGLQMVAQEFGNREHGLISKDDWNLFQWYSYELNSTELQQMRNLWHKSGLPF